MTDRERWTVYPLLFLALALAVRDKVIPSIPATLIARELTIVGEDDRPNILLRGGNKQGSSPAIEILNAKGNPAWIVSVGGRDGVGIENTGSVVARELLIVGADGKQRVILGNTGSVIARNIQIVGADGKERVVLGVSDKSMGAGQIEWYDANRNLVLAAGGAASEGGAISSFRPGNIPQFSFGSNERGSIVIVRDLKGKPYFVLMGDDQGEGRALLFDAHGSGQLIVGKPVNVQINEVPAPKKEGEAAPDEQKPTDEQANPDAPKEPVTENSEAPPTEEKPAEEKPEETPPAAAAEPPTPPPAEVKPQD